MMHRMARRRSASVAIVAVLAAPLASFAGRAAPERALAITNVSVIPMDRARVLANQTVIVRGGRVEAVGAAAAVAIPPNTERIDGTGRFLIPGLTDAHVHYDEDSPDSDAHVGEINREYSALFLSAGVTTVMNLCGSAGNLLMRDSIARGAIAGPRVFTSPHCLNDSTMSAAQGDSAAVASKRAGYDFLKVYSFLSDSGFSGIMAGAHRVGIPVVGHIPIRVGLHRMLDAGAVGIVHAEEFLYNAPFRLN